MSPNNNQAKVTRPEVNAAMTLCSRSLTGQQSMALQVARHNLQLTRPKSNEKLEAWFPQLELEILIGFTVDPSRYSVHVHDFTLPGQPCPDEDALKEFKKVSVKDVVTGPFEVHFVLRDDVRAFSVEDLRKWQTCYAEIAADPSPAPFENLVTICESRDHIANVVVDRLPLPPTGDVTISLRRGLGLPTEDLVKLNLGKALKFDFKDKEVAFHLDGEDCSSIREVDQLATTALAPDRVVKLHLPSNPEVTFRTFSPAEEGSDLEGETGDEED